MTHAVGYRRYQWFDAVRERPVWGDVWYPAPAATPEAPVSYGLGQGRAALDAPLAEVTPPPTLAVLSHGAFGSARDYGWLGELFARHGMILLGVSHYGESWIYGRETISPKAATELWHRPPDCSFALDQLLATLDIGRAVHRSPIHAVGHSSGGATAVALAGAVFDPTLLWDYCQSANTNGDRGCDYGRATRSERPTPRKASARDPRISAIVLLDPAAGPGYSAATLGSVRIPALIVGATDNDFLPFAHHAGHYAAALAEAQLVTLDSGEGHFVYLNECVSDMTANGVPLCRDRPGVDRQAVQARVGASILAFLESPALHANSTRPELPSLP